MYSWLAQMLGNLSVNRKLGIGFGLVLLLTLLITFTGWSGLNSLISRGDKLGAITSVNDQDICASKSASLDSHVREKT